MDTTTIILASDNGTPGDVLLNPFDASGGKGTVLDYGVHVPVIVAGASVDPALYGTRAWNLVNFVDIYAMLANITAGFDVPTLEAKIANADISDMGEIDGFDYCALLVGAEYVGRQWIFSEQFSPNGLNASCTFDSAMRTIRDLRYKLIRTTHSVGQIPPDRFYDLSTDPYEEQNLITLGLTAEQQSAFDFLSNELIALLATSDADSGAGCAGAGQ